MKKLVTLFLMLIMLVPCTATSIDFEKEENTHHGGTRMPSRMKVSADYEDGVVSVNVVAFTGNVEVCIYDSEGNIVGYESAPFTGNSSLTIDINALEGTNCTITVALNGTVYYGQFEV